MIGHLRVERVVDRDPSPGHLIDPIHMKVKLIPVSAMILVSFRDKEIGVYHLVLEELAIGMQVQQR